MKIFLYFKKENTTEEEIYKLLDVFLKGSQPLLEKKNFTYILYKKLNEENLFYGIKELCKTYDLKTEDSIYRKDKNFILSNEFNNIYQIRVEAEEQPENYVLNMSYDEFTKLYGSSPENEPEDHLTNVKELRCPYCGSFLFRSVYIEDVEYFKNEETNNYEEGWQPGADWDHYACDNCYGEVEGL